MSERNAPSTLLRSILAGGSVAYAGELVARALQLLVNTQINRALGPALLGQYSGVLAILSIIGSLLGFGLDTWLLREGGREPAALGRHMRAVLLIKACGVAVVAAMLIVAGRITVLSPSIVLGCVAILADSLTNTGYSALRVLKHNSWIAAAQILQPLALLAALFAFGDAGVTPLWWIGVNAVTGWLLVAFVFSRVRGQMPPSTGRTALTALVAGAYAFVAADLLANVYSQASVYALTQFATNEAAGLFKAANGVIIALQIAPLVIFNVALPQLSNHAVTPDQFRRTVQRLTLGALAYGAVAAAAAAIAAPLLIRIMSGPEFGAAVPLLRLMALSPLMKALSFVCVAVILARRKQSWRIVVQAIVAALTVLSAFFVIPRAGAAGASWLLLGTEFGLLLGYFAAARLALRASSAS
jgi:O-antigen/teichoic acid export membrane protein